MPLTLRPSDSPHAGWLRGSADGKRWSPWLLACRAAGYWRCWPGLLRAAGRASHEELVVLPEGKRPNASKQPRRKHP